MGNIFRQQQDLSGKPKRNTFDMSFQNNLTLQMGCITPTLSQEVLAGDTFRINSSVGIKLMPTTFPVQTPMDFVQHFYFVPYRTLWKDYMDYFGRVKQVTMPYLSIPAARAHELATGSLADYLGVPTTLAHQRTSLFTLPAPLYVNQSKQTGSVLQTDVQEPDTPMKFGIINDVVKAPLASGNYPFSANLASRHNVAFKITTLALTGDLHKIFMVGKYHWQIASNQGHPQQLTLDDHYETWLPGFNFADVQIPAGTVISNRSLPITLQGYVPTIPAHKTYLLVWKPTANNRFSDSVLFDIFSVSLGDGTKLTLSADDLARINQQLQSTGLWFSVASQYFSDPSMDMYDNGWCGLTNAMIIETSNANVTDVEEVSRLDGMNPFIDYGSGPKIPINALNFRAYEAIFNAYYRNERLNPFTINGVPEYNKYIPNDDGGPDTFSYQLHYRNWEDDYFTSCLDSPQQGLAPLVGVSSTGTFTFKDQNNVTYTMECITQPDGTLTGINSYSSDLPEGNVHRMQELITHGISINDFRSTNALQRWAEKNWRNGLKFRDQLRAHFGVTPKFDTLQMPQFIGGMHEPIEIQQVTNLAASDSAPLGDFAGQGYVAGRQKHSITYYADEPGVIMAVCMIVPRPCYSQTLKKSLAKSDLFDYYFPEFANIGYQPVFNYELAPLQASYEDETQSGSDKLRSVFGYQRPWADYIANYDEIHGQFRTTLQSFVMSRTFDSTPELGKSFITINPLSVNNVFAVDASVDDKFIGQIRFDIVAKRPIPRFGIPRIE